VGRPNIADGAAAPFSLLVADGWAQVAAESPTSGRNRDGLEQGFNRIESPILDFLTVIDEVNL
jgi:hypothetical protein